MHLRLQQNLKGGGGAVPTQTERGAVRMNWCSQGVYAPQKCFVKVFSDVTEKVCQFQK